jgi:predicted hydrocarbon binding protein
VADEITSGRALPNLRVRILMQAIQEVMGRNGLNATLKLAGLQRYINNLPPANQATELHASEYAALLQAIETLLGSGARGQLNRIGHATFKKLVESDRARWNIIGFFNRFLPARQQLQRSLAALARHLALPDGDVGVFSDDQRLVLVDNTGDATQGRNRATEICWLTVGQIQECAQWATGSNYDITEVSCKAKGEAECRFEIGERLG